MLSLIHLFTLQGLTLVASTTMMAYFTQQPHLYYSAGLTFALKVLIIPWLLHRLIKRLNVRWDVESLINIPTTMLLGIVLVIFAFNLAAADLEPVRAPWRAARSGIALAVRAAVVPDDDHAHQGDRRR